MLSNGRRFLALKGDAFVGGDVWAGYDAENYLAGSMYAINGNINAQLGSTTIVTLDKQSGFNDNTSSGIDPDQGIQSRAEV